MSNSFDDDDEIARLCRKNEKWQPPKAIGTIEDCFKKFEETMNLETSKRVHLKNSNLTKIKHNGLNYLKKESVKC